MVQAPRVPSRTRISAPAGRSTRDFGPRSGDDHYVLYTGGTTGRPKGVVWRQEDIFVAALGGGNPGGPPIDTPEAIGPGVLANPAGRVAVFLDPAAPPPPLVALALGPLIHASGQWSTLGTLLSGGAVVLYTEPHLDAAAVLDLVARERVVSLNLVGDAVARPLVELLEARPDGWDTSSLVLLGSGGSILSGDVKDRLLAALPSVTALIDGIGSSESPAQAVALTTRGGAPSASLRFTAKATTMVVDEDLRPVPAGAGIVGRLATTGRVPLRYLGDPERSARTFVEIDGKRWSLPGDMATIDADGTVQLLGRGSFCINTGGEKVYPEEVEAVVKAHPLVADAVVVGVPDPRWGERVAVIVAAPGDAATGAGPTLEDLQAHCRSLLAGYKTPRVLHVVDEIVRLPTGKADYSSGARRGHPVGLTSSTRPSAWRANRPARAVHRIVARPRPAAEPRAPVVVERLLDLLRVFITNGPSLRPARRSAGPAARSISTSSVPPGSARPASAPNCTARVPASSAWSADRDPGRRGRSRRRDGLRRARRRQRPARARREPDRPDRDVGSARAAHESGGGAGASAPSSAPAHHGDLVRPASSTRGPAGSSPYHSIVKYGSTSLLARGRFSQIWNSSTVVRPLALEQREHLASATIALAGGQPLHVAPPEPRGRAERVAVIDEARAARS